MSNNEKLRSQRQIEPEEFDKAKAVKKAWLKLREYDKDTDPHTLCEALNEMAVACIDLRVWTERHRLFREPKVGSRNENESHE